MEAKEMNQRISTDAGMARKLGGRQRLLGAVIWMLAAGAVGSR
jgi:hypothetical protein